VLEARQAWPMFSKAVFEAEQDRTQDLKRDRQGCLRGARPIMQASKSQRSTRKLESAADKETDLDFQNGLWASLAWKIPGAYPTVAWPTDPSNATEGLSGQADSPEPNPLKLLRQDSASRGRGSRSQMHSPRTEDPAPGLRVLDLSCPGMSHAPNTPACREPEELSRWKGGCPRSG